MTNQPYISGVFRGEGGEYMVTHLYAGTFDEPGALFCSSGWQRKYFDKDGNLIDWEYSIFRNNYSKAGICKVCLKRATAGLPPVTKPRAKYNPINPNHFIDK